MEVDKEIIFSLAGIDKSEWLLPLDFGARNDSQTIQTCPHTESD
jgi:hypothetical protein